jgi:hypothetical protein
MSKYFVEIMTALVIFIVLILLVRLYAKESSVADAITDALGEDDAESAGEGGAVDLDAAPAPAEG